MRRALLPWLFPIAILLALLVAITNSTIVYGAVAIVFAWVVAPLGLAAARRSGTLPSWLQRLLQGDPEGRGPRIPGL